VKNDITYVDIDARSRDDMPATLKRLQYIYTNESEQEKIFHTLEAVTNNATLDSSVSADVGRPGMELWTIFVLATLKLGLNCDVDRLQNWRINIVRFVTT